MPWTVARPLHERDLVLVTGKGGVGKTTFTAALAEVARREGKRTLVAEVTTDVATRSHLLGHFGAPHPKGEEPVHLDANLDGVRITPATGHRLFLRAALRVGMLADAAMRSAALNRFLMAAPAFPEIGTLYQLVWLLRLERYERIVIDLPATGHALGLAKLPRTVSRVVPRGLIKEAITEGLEVLTDPQRTGAVIATLPESLPVTEAFELAKGLREVEVPVGALVLNRMPEDPFTPEERQALNDHIQVRKGELLLGTRELRRLERALEARETFRERSLDEAESIEVPVFDGAFGQVVRQIADHLMRVREGRS